MKRLTGEKFLEYGETAVQVLFLIYTALGFNSITFGSRIISVLMWITYLLGAAVLLVRLWNWKRYIQMPGLLCLVAMCAVCVVSIGMNLRYDLKKNVIYLIFWIFYFFLYFAQREDMAPELAKKRFRLAGLLICVFAFVLSAVSLWMMEARYAEVLTVQGTQIIRGFAQGRLFGAYLNPNGGAFVSAVVIVLSIWLLRDCRNYACRVFCVINILLQFLYLVFSDSRGGRLCLAVGLAAYVLFEAIYSKWMRNNPWKGLIVALLVISTAASAWLAPKWTQDAYNGFIAELSLHMSENQGGETEKAGDTEQPNASDVGKEPQDFYQVNRGYDLSGDISNRRFDIWKSGLEVFFQKPVTGHTFSGFLPFAEENMVDTYIVANDSRKMDTLENDFLNLLVSNGVIGFLLFIVFIVRILIYLFRRIFLDAYRDGAIPVMMAICALVAVFSMFNSSMLYSHCQNIPLFWLSLGSMIAIVSHREKEVCNDAGTH